jgi:hypothetical protein
MIDLGNTQIDKGLLDALLDTGVKEPDAKEIARMDVFGGCIPSAWIAGLRGAATLFNRGTCALDWGTLPQPWFLVGPALCSDGVEPGKTLIDALADWSGDAQSAIINAVGAIVMQMALADSSARQSSNQANQNLPEKMKPVDPALMGRIQGLLNRKGTKDQKRKAAGEQLLDWMWNNGDFIRTVYGSRYYLYRAKHRLFSLDSASWRTWLYLLSGCNPASANFAYLDQDCQTAAEQYGSLREVVRVAHWDGEQQILRISRFDGMVYRLDGLTFETEANGDGPVLFEDAPYWQPYEPDFSAQGSVLDWSTSSLPSWDGAREGKSIVYLAWVLATFFTELCPTRPVLVMKGEKGSGKSMLLRVLLRLLFGPTIDVVGVPEKPDAFTSLTSNSHLVCFDNMDDLVKPIQDKVASLSTGKIDTVRKLYTTNEQQIIRYRCWLAVTSRTPDTFQRDDLADRILILPLCRIEDDDRTRESRFLLEVMTKRNQWWGDVLSALNSVVHEIHGSGIPDKGGLRMEDWAALGSVIARSRYGMQDWVTGLKEVKARQTEFLLENDIVVTAVEAWLSSQLYTNTPLATRALYQAAKSVLFGMNPPDSTWPRSVRSFGRRLAGIQRELREHLAKSGVQMYWGISAGNATYTFIKSP